MGQPQFCSGTRACSMQKLNLLQEKKICLAWKIRSRFFIELAQALNYLHIHDPNKPYIHEDLKPENVLLGDKLEVRLADFGASAIAKLTDNAISASTSDGNINIRRYKSRLSF